jgi:hypothetical protein
MTVWLWLKWFFVPNGIIWTNRMLEATPYAKYKHIAIREKWAGRKASNGTCKICNDKYATVKNDPVCDRWSCYRTYYSK